MNIREKENKESLPACEEADEKLLDLEWGR